MTQLLRKVSVSQSLEIDGSKVTPVISIQERTMAGYVNLPAASMGLDHLNSAVRKALLESGYFAIEDTK